MKQIKQTYILLLAATLSLLTACYNDEPVNIDNPAQQDGKITVHLRVSQAAPTMTRAEGDKWKDPNAKDEEMMNVWTVVAVNTDNKVAAIYACKPKGDGQEEIDDVVTLPDAGDYRFYSFANMSPKKVMDLLNIQSPETLDSNSGEILASNFNTISDNTIVNIAFKDDAIVNADADENNIPINVQGNGFNPEADDNGFGSKGIPMSNVQTLTLANGDTKDLIVIRMLAKIKLQIYNDSGKDITINSVTLTSLTSNTKEGDTEYKNLMLLPKLSKGQDTMESSGQYHGDIEPNLNESVEQEEYTYTPISDKKIDKGNNTLASGTPVEYVFYVNESENPKGENWEVNGGTAQEFNRYFLKIDIDGEEQQRYALIDDSNAASDDTGKWNYIARNDYRIIPIVLDDYKLDLIPYDFPAIGVYPASVKEEDGIYTITFHDYGHFHLVPQVTKYSSPTTVVSYSQTTISNAADDYWTLPVQNTLGAAWGPWTDATKIDTYSGDFYRDKTDDKDGDDAGGVPIWYKNDGTDGPQWSPNGTTENYPPFIFGYIANPGSKLTEGDKKVYHEFTINLYKSGTGAARQMTYRLYMLLDQSQMLYSRSLGAPATRHTHGH